MTVRQLLKINKIINDRDKNGYVYGPAKRKDCGSLIIDKNVDCALYDSWGGGGGCWGIELEKDIELPIKFIHKAVPDGCLDYSMKKCYGVASDCWKGALWKSRTNSMQFLISNILKKNSKAYVLSALRLISMPKR